MAIDILKDVQFNQLLMLFNSSVCLFGGKGVKWKFHNSNGYGFELQNGMLIMRTKQWLRPRAKEDYQQISYHRLPPN